MSRIPSTFTTKLQYIPSQHNGSENLWGNKKGNAFEKSIDIFWVLGHRTLMIGFYIDFYDVQTISSFIHVTSIHTTGTKYV